MAQTNVDPEVVGTGRIVKRRASRACLSCRAKKIKCSVVKSGIPCHNCRLDENECVVSERRRKRFRIEEPPPNHSTESPIAGVEQTDVQETLSAIDRSLATAPTSLDLEAHIFHRAHGKTSANEGRPFLISRPSAPNLASPLRASGARPSPPRHFQVLPNYIRALPPEIGAEDVEFLNKKGALKTPEVGLRNQLLRNYVQYVHPYMPLIDLEDFLQSIECNDSSNQISLMLFHAVMFAASAYIDMPLLNAEGYATRKSIRKIFFQKVKLLYDFGYESDRISNIQALLLITYWYETPNDQKDPWHWLGASLSFAYTIGLHRNMQSDIDPRKWRLRKRLWWSCFMRDRLLALSMRKPTRIKNEDCDVPMLVLDDFDTQPLPPKLVHILLGDCAAATDITMRTTLAKLCVEKVKLCFCIGHVLAVQYSVLGHKIGLTGETNTGETNMILKPKGPASAARLVEVIECEQELSQWHDNLPEDCRYRIQGANAHNCEELSVHRAILSMIYSTTISALHRPQVQLKLPSQPIARNLQQLSRLRVKEAATEITEIAQDLHDQYLTRFLPPIGVTVLIPAIIIHFLDTKSDNAAIRDIGSRYFRQCIQILQRLREVYASADAAFLFLEAAIGTAKVNIPERPEQRNLMNHDDALIARTDTYTAQLTHPVRSSPDARNGFQTQKPLQSDRGAGFTGAELAAAAPSHPSTLEESTEINNDFDASINFNIWSDLFMAESGLYVDLDMDWAVDFYSDVAQTTTNSSSGTSSTSPVFSPGHFAVAES